MLSAKHISIFNWSVETDVGSLWLCFAPSMIGPELSRINQSHAKRKLIMTSIAWERLHGYNLSSHRKRVREISS